MSYVHLREAVESDVDLLYKWANDPVVRKNSFNSDPISYQTHVSWFHRMMGNESVLQYIMMEDETPVGQIRLIINEDEAEIGYSIGPDYRGKGYGHKILQLIVEVIKSDHPEIKRLIAKVKPENNASNKLFIEEGYDLVFSLYSYEINIDDYSVK